MPARNVQGARGGKKFSGKNRGKVRIKTRIKREDQVKVISGRDKGKTGRVLSVDSRRGTVLVEGVSLIKRHTRPNPSKQIKGGIAEKESSIAISNVMVLTSGGVPTRVGYRIEGSGATSHRVRVAKKSGEQLDKRG